MNFKEMVLHDIDNVIFNPDELGTEVTLNGQRITAIKDSTGSDQFNNKNTPGLLSADLMLYVRKKDLTKEVKADMVITVDGEKYIVQSANGFQNIQLVLKRMRDCSGTYR